jgi:hypothetical protein
VATLAALAGCQTSSPTAGCQLAQEVVLSASPLTLLQGARLDRINDGFVLIGADGDGGSVRWAALDAATGQLGAEHAVPVPAHQGGPWFAVAGRGAPGDSVLVAFTAPAANGVDAELRVLATAADGSTAAPDLSVVAALLGGAGGQPTAAMGSSRLGMAGGLAWADAGAIKAVVLSGSGHPVTTVLPVDTVPALSCLAFVAGRNELALGYYRYPDASSPSPSWVIAEMRESGGIESTLTLALKSDGAGCPQHVTPSGGYAMAWQNPQGSWLGVYDATSNRFYTYPFAAAANFGGADLQPPLAGLAPMGSDYAVTLARPTSVELWRLSRVGTHRPGALVFPSAAGNMGSVSSVAVTGALYSTYADYTATDAGVGAGGQRYFLKATCM